ncbi:MAG: acyl-CoA dehydrogenase family protein [Gammaproteobacteria bacterium]|nr:acyl-CoA dehydrogenase family protein [Gammaproteobacteria bacterium]
MIEFELSEEQLQLQDTARRFAENEIMPVAASTDRIADPRQSYPKEVIRKGFELGFQSILVPEKYGGMGGTPLEYAILLEELAVGDIGMANAFHATITLTEMILKNGSEQQREKWLRPLCDDQSGAYLIGFGATEPSGGTEIFCPRPDPKLGTRTTAVKNGNHYIINGRKTYTSNASVSKLYGVLVRTDITKPNAESCSVFFFPADTPGFSIGRIEDKMGHRASMNGELIFESVKLPREYLLGEEGGGFDAIRRVYDSNGVGTGAMAVGVARAAYEVALGYAKERQVWGESLKSYQAIGNLLVDMRADIEMARLLVRRVAWQSSNHCSEGSIPPNMAKVYPAEMARRVTINALQVLGGAGYMKDYPTEKYVRDAMVLPIISGGNEALKYFMSRDL